ncbi:MAG: hypothetical protein CMJ83_01370 [Planctomycetes bacterium]|nr:hypothetical protein [Planctomycetota bacterium]
MTTSPLEDHELEACRKGWEALGAEDPRFAVLSDPCKRGGGWDPQVFDETGRRQIEDAARLLACHGVTFKSGAALDFGCGVARLTAPLATTFERVVGLDISRPMLEGARARLAGVENAALVQSSSTSIPFRDRVFDAVLAHLVLIHVPPATVPRYLAEFRRVLNRGGICTFTVATQVPHGQGTQRIPIRAGDELSPRILLSATPRDQVLAWLAALSVKIEMHLPDDTPQADGVQFETWVFRRI